MSSMGRIAASLYPSAMRRLLLRSGGPVPTTGSPDARIHRT